MGDGRILFLKGQQYYAADEKMAWPNAEFEIWAEREDVVEASLEDFVRSIRRAA